MVNVGIGDSVRWSVMWRTDNDKIIEHECEGDLDEAIRIKGVAERAGREDVTLRSMNVGFPPPAKFRPHNKKVIRKKKVKRKGKWKVVERREFVSVTPMEKANDVGIFWCPYCRKFRRFQLQRAYFCEGKMRRDPRRGGSLYCPMCGVSHRDFHVRRWNPVAWRLYLTESRRTKNRGRARRSSARR